MRYRDYSPIPEKDGKLALIDQLQGMLKYGFRWPKEMQSQRVCGCDSLKRSLDNRFTLVRNLMLPEAEIQIPLLLIGPHGVSLLNPTPIQGVFQAKENSWLISTPRGYEAASPNWIQRTQLLAKAVTVFMKRNEQLIAEASGILVFTNPGTHVDTSRPAVRILLSDGLSRFAAGLSQETPVLSGEDIYKLVRALTKSAEATDELEDLDIDGQESTKPEKEAPRGPSQLEKSLAPLGKTFNFDRKQWLILAGLFGATVIVLFAFLLLIIFIL